MTGPFDLRLMDLNHLAEEMECFPHYQICFFVTVSSTNLKMLKYNNQVIVYNAGKTSHVEINNLFKQEI